MQSLNTDIDSIGGGFGGLGGFGNNPLLWLITLGFLKDGGIGGNSGGADSAKLDCLAQQHGQLADQIRGNTQQGQFAQLSNEVARVATYFTGGNDEASKLIKKAAIMRPLFKTVVILGFLAQYQPRYNKPKRYPLLFARLALYLSLSAPLRIFPDKANSLALAFEVSAFGTNVY